MLGVMPAAGLAVVVAAGGHAALNAQCETAWQSMIGPQAVLGTIKAMARWDPDGAGPLPPHLVVGGAFANPTTLITNNLALFEPISQTWSLLGGAADGSVEEIALLPNGGLAVAGSFAQIGGVPAAGIAIWNGNSWSGLPGAVGNIRALAVDAAGMLIAGGTFQTIGGVAAENVARWNGSTWQAMGAGLASAPPTFPFPLVVPGVHDLALLPNGQVMAAGALTSVVAAWNGTTWTPLPAAPGTWLAASELLIDSNLDLIVAGATSLSPSSVARWDGSNWSALGSLSSWITDIGLLPNGDLVACGNSNGAGVFRWNGTAWATIGAPPALAAPMYAVQAFPLTDPNGFYVGGNLPSMQGVEGVNLFRYSGASWIGESRGLSGVVNGVTSFPDGDTFAFGDFTSIGGVPISRLARWGQAWTPVASSVPAAVSAVGKSASGDLLAATQNGVYRLVGGNFQLMQGSPGGIGRMLLRPNGEVLASGSTGLWRLAGANWLLVYATQGVLGFANLPNGDVLLTGESLSTFPISYGRMAVWDGGSTWTAFDPNWTVTSPSDVVVLDNGDVAVLDSSVVRRFDGSAWSQLGNLNSSVFSLRQNAAGDLFASGYFTAEGAAPCRYIARWDGSAWRQVAGGAAVPVRTFAPSANGDMISLWSPSIFTTPVLAVHRTACPAAALSVSAACPGSVGTSQMSATQLPLIGGEYRARATGLSNNVVAFDMYGLQATSVPIATLFPISAPSCVGAVVPLTFMARVANGTFDSSLAIPAQAALAGYQVRHQALLFDFDSQNNLIAVAVTNALEMTIGSSY
jgi:hypothetical protein